jgi:hypothetical protein
MELSNNDGVLFLNTNKQQQDDAEPEVTLAIDGERQNNYKGKKKDKAKVTCHRCSKKGHYAPKCDQEKRQEPHRPASRC